MRWLQIAADGLQPGFDDGGRLQSARGLELEAFLHVSVGGRSSLLLACAGGARERRCPRVDGGVGVAVCPQHALGGHHSVHACLAGLDDVPLGLMRPAAVVALRC